MCVFAGAEARSLRPPPYQCGSCTPAACMAAAALLAAQTMVVAAATVVLLPAPQQLRVEHVNAPVGIGDTRHAHAAVWQLR